MMMKPTRLNATITFKYLDTAHFIAASTQSQGNCEIGNTDTEYQIVSKQILITNHFHLRGLVSLSNTEIILTVLAGLAPVTG